MRVNRIQVDLKKALVAEFIGTFILVFAGTGAMVVNEITNGAITHLGIALIFGLVVMVMVYTLGHISGAHINPAVTVGFAVAGEFPAKRIAPYIAVQCLGAIAASFILLGLLGNHANMGATLPLEIKEGQRLPLACLVLEGFLTFILMFVILNVAVNAPDKKAFVGIIIGGIIAVESGFAGPISGASMNPARSLGPALASGNFTDFWIYLAGPLAGALAAVPAWRFVRLAKRKPERPRRNPRERSQQRIQPTKKQQWKKKPANPQS